MVSTTRAAVRRHFARASFLVALSFVQTGIAQAKAQDLPTDAVLARLIDETLSTLPELDSGSQLILAQQARVSQAGAWPDPILQLGIQNDGFKSIQIGMMETSFVSLMASQTVPWPGKTSLRESIGDLATTEAKHSLARLRLSAEAFVRRSYLDLMWVRERRALLGERVTLSQRALDAARSRYEVGSGAKVDLLRARLELSRLEQQRALLDAQEQSTLQALNRMRHHELTEPISTARSVKDLPSPAAQLELFSADRAATRSPELAAAKTQTQRASKQIELAQTSYYPDLTLGAGFMYRGGLPPMWLVTVAAPVPIFAGSKQGAAVTESRALDRAARDRTRMVEQLVRLRSTERRAQFTALLETIRLYESGLLEQSARTADAMLIQYQAGKASFASVLETNAGLIADRQGYLGALVQAESLLISEREVSLQGTASPSMGPSSAGMAAPTSAQPDATSSSPANAPSGAASAPATSPASGGSMPSM